MVKLIAATGCPVGIAHTYMAQEALEMAAKAKNITIKVETHGQIGVENGLTDEEIASADAVIIAADKDVGMDRFIGKRVVEASVTQGIKEADKLIEEALNGGGHVIGGEKNAASNVKKNTNAKTNSSGKLSLGSAMYKHLMNGISHMLPFVVAGGFLTGMSFLWGIYSADPASAQYNEIAAMIKTIGGVGMGLMVPIFAAYIGMSISSTPGLVAGFIGGMIADTSGTGFIGGIFAGFLGGYVVYFLSLAFKKLPKILDGLKAIFLLPVCAVFITGVIMLLLAEPIEWLNSSLTGFIASFQDSSPIVLGTLVGVMCCIDYGGPFNKAAYVTALALLAEGNQYMIAGVSAACIVPPLATGIAVLGFKKYYDEEEFSSGIVNILLGCTHITEGAIPFVAKDPLRNMPSMMLGGAIGASLTYMFGVQDPAPHGGFIVIPVVEKAHLWVLSIIIGAIVSGLLLGYFKKRSYNKLTAAEG
ncbi:MAG: PTS fructose transporter subunit IIC [Enterococcus hulanensis]